MNKVLLIILSLFMYSCELDGQFSTGPAEECNGTATEDCEGTCGGSAAEDECGVCDSDISNDCILDCAGDWGGSAAEDECGVCDYDIANDCTLDCAGEWGGDSWVSDCGCVPADNAGNDCDDCPENFWDCGGNCCVGTPGVDGKIYTDGAITDADCFLEDECGVCDSDISNDCVQDCNGEWGGTAIFLFPDQGLSNYCYDIESTTELDLSNQGFTGTIPPEIGQLINLTYLDLWGNELTGQIPPEISSLVNLNELSLGENQLSGEIPSEVCDLIENNNLEMDAILQGNNLINTCE